MLIYTKLFSCNSNPFVTYLDFITIFIQVQHKFLCKKEVGVALYINEFVENVKNHAFSRPVALYRGNCFLKRLKLMQKQIQGSHYTWNLLTYKYMQYINFFLFNILTIWLIWIKKNFHKKDLKKKNKKTPEFQASTILDTN